jgi:hypothetical protein
MSRPFNRSVWRLTPQRFSSPLNAWEDGTAASWLCLAMDILRNVEPPLISRPPVYRPYFVECAVAAVVSCFRNFTGSHFAPFRAARHLCSIAEAIKIVFFMSLCTKAREICPVPIRAEANQIAGVALGTLHAMAKAKRHRDSSS